jgi:hypothetical protein
MASPGRRPEITAVGMLAGEVPSMRKSPATPPNVMPPLPVTAPFANSSVPPESMVVVPLAVPPDTNVGLPLLPTVVLLAVPSGSMVIWPAITSPEAASPKTLLTAQVERAELGRADLELRVPRGFGSGAGLRHRIPS